MKTLLTSFIIIFLSISTLQAKKQSHVFVLVHGAWHGSWTYYVLKYELQKAGHTAICINLPGHGLDTTNGGRVTLTDYQNAITNVLDSISKPAVLVGHSMGGIAISMAAEARPEKVDKLVYLAAFMPKNGESMLDLAMQDSTSMIGPSLIIDTVNKVVDLVRENISDIFYDTSTAEYVILSKMLLVPNPLIPLATPLTLTEENYGSVRKFYITTKYDKAITPEFQKKMYLAQNCEKIYTLNTEHSPFFSAPNNLKNILDKIGDDKKPDKPVKPVFTNAENNIETPEPDLRFDFIKEQITINHPELVNSFSIAATDINGKLLFKQNLTPNSFSFEISFKKPKEKIIILFLIIDGKTYTRKYYFE